MSIDVIVVELDCENETQEQIDLVLPK
jgi:hypothetical protein